MMSAAAVDRILWRWGHWINSDDTYRRLGYGKHILDDFIKKGVLIRGKCVAGEDEESELIDKIITQLTAYNQQLTQSLLAEYLLPAWGSDEKARYLKISRAKFYTNICAATTWVAAYLQAIKKPVCLHQRTKEG